MLQNIKPGASRNQFTAKCPAHDDWNNSFCCSLFFLLIFLWFYVTIIEYKKTSIKRKKSQLFDLAVSALLSFSQTSKQVPLETSKPKSKLNLSIMIESAHFQFAGSSDNPITTVWYNTSQA
ncbi:MAG: hypothetical protein FWC97_11515 [Treponema sp.]|nr:hypothetical protein [Treponema sp.]